MIVGAFDDFSETTVLGWALDLTHPDVPVRLQVLVDDRPAGTVLAEKFRNDLRSNAAHGFCSFSFQIPTVFFDGGVHKVSIRNSLTGNELKLSPKTVTLRRHYSRPNEPPAALIGKDGWLFLCRDSNASLDWYQGYTQFNEQELEVYCQLFNNRSKYFKSIGVPYIFVSVPGKESIYPEYLPDGLEKSPNGILIDQLSGYLQERCDMQIVDLRSLLMRAKSHGRIYFKNDSHMNHLGSYFAYSVVVNAVRQFFPMVGFAKPLQDFEIKYEEVDYGDLLGKPQVNYAGTGDFELALTPVVIRSEERPIPIPRQQTLRARSVIVPEALKVSETRETVINQVDDGSLPSTLVFRDSHADLMIRHLSEHFRRSTYIWQPEINYKAVEFEKPDVVIQIMTERFLARRPQA